MRFHLTPVVRMAITKKRRRKRRQGRGRRIVVAVLARI
jgi:hypothetical protein